MAFSHLPTFARVDIGQSGIEGMVGAMSQAVRIGLTEDMPLVRALAGRIVAGCAARDSQCEVASVYDFVRDGGVLRGETLVRGPRFVYESDGHESRPGEYRVELPGGAVRVFDFKAHRLLRTVPPGRAVRFRLPPQPWQGLRYTSETVRLDTYSTLARSLETGIGDCDDASVMLVTLLKSLGYFTGFKIISVHGKAWEHVYAVVGLPKKNPQRWVALDTTDDRFGLGDDPTDVLRLPGGGPLPARVFVV